MTERRLLLVTALSAGLLLLSPAARADDVTQAKAHFAIGARAYESNQFGVAVEAFTEAYRLAPRAAILFSIAQAHRRQYFAERQPPDLTAAIDYYRRYVKDDPKGKRVGEALTALADLEAVAARLAAPAAPAPAAPAEDAVTAPETPPAPAAPAPPRSEPALREARLLIAPSVSGATARVDGGKPVELPNRIDVEPGRHSVLIEARGYQPERREVDVGAGESFALDVRLLERPAFVTPRVEDGVRIYIDGRFATTTPLRQPLELSAGRHSLGLARTGHVPVSLELELEPGEARAVDAQFRTSKQRITSYVLFGAAGVALLGGGTLTGLALGAEESAADIDERASTGNITAAERAEHEQAIDDRNLLRGVALGAFGAGIGLGAAGALLYFLDQPEPAVTPVKAPERAPREQPELELGFMPLLSPEGAGLGVRGAL
jgi:hypothetical protein